MPGVTEVVKRSASGIASTSRDLLTSRHFPGRRSGFDQDTADLLEVLVDTSWPDGSYSDDGWGSWGGLSDVSEPESEREGNNTATASMQDLKVPLLDQSKHKEAEDLLGREPGGEPELPVPVVGPRSTESRGNLEGDNLASENLIKTTPVRADVQQQRGNNNVQQGNTIAQDKPHEETSTDTKEDDSDGPPIPPVLEEFMPYYNTGVWDNAWIAEVRPREDIYDTHLTLNTNDAYVISPVRLTADRDFELMRSHNKLIDGGCIVKALLRYDLTYDCETREWEGQEWQKVFISLRIRHLTGYTFHDESGEPLLDACGNKHHITLVNEWHELKWNKREKKAIRFIKPGSIEWAVREKIENRQDKDLEQIVYLCKWTPPDYEGEKQPPLMCVRLTQDIVHSTSRFCSWSNRTYFHDVEIADRCVSTYHISCHKGFDFGPCAEVSSELMPFWEDFCSGVFNEQYGVNEEDQTVSPWIMNRECYLRPMVRWVNHLILTGKASISEDEHGSQLILGVPPKDFTYGRTAEEWGMAPFE